MEFTKMHGLGNDFILVDGRDDSLGDLGALAIKVCARNTGVGADGLLVVQNSSTCDIRMTIVNNDGSGANMCGNGIRCFAKYVYEHGIVTTPEFTVETGAGTITPRVIVQNGLVKSVCVDMGIPRFEREAIPMQGEGKFIEEPLAIKGMCFTATAMLMSIPQTVVFVKDIATLDIKKLGPAVETHPLFPQGTNVNFVQVLDAHTIISRPWERGCGITLACGTGACAAAVACAISGKTGRNVSVKLALGTLDVEYSPAGRVFMTGPAETVCNGVLRLFD